MGKDHLGEYDTFYQEIPATNDYLSGFDTEIEDLTDEVVTCEGLEADQVPRLAQDTLHEDHFVSPLGAEKEVEEPSLFDQDEA